MVTHESSLKQFEEQIEYALSVFNKNKIKSASISNIVICGLGGSGIGGRIARGFFLDKSKYPIEVISDYFLPAYCNKETLVILSSYSGNTEETLRMFEIADKRGCQIIGICSGGILEELLKSKGYTYYNVPTGFQPRMALGFSLTLNILILSHLNNFDVKSSYQNIVDFYKEKDKYIDIATNITNAFENSADNIFHIFCDEFMKGAAIRFSQQIQENAKGQAFISVIPESNHNVIESLQTQINSNIIFLDSGSNERVSKRFNFLEELFQTNNIKIVKLPIKGNKLEEIYKVIYILDWVSIFISNIKGVNNMQVNIIQNLKKYLS